MTDDETPSGHDGWVGFLPDPPAFDDDDVRAFDGEIESADLSIDGSTEPRSTFDDVDPDDFEGSFSITFGGEGFDTQDVDCPACGSPTSVPMIVLAFTIRSEPIPCWNCGHPLL